MLNEFEKITDFIPLRTLQKVQNDFVKVMGFPLKIVDACNGEMICQSSNPFAQHLCTLFLNHKNCRISCNNLNEILKNKPLEDKKSCIYIYQCDFELRNFVIPITINGKIMAYVLGGPVRFTNPDLRLSEKIAAELGVSIDQYLEAFLSLPLFSEEMLESLGQFLKTVFNSMASIAFSSFADKIKAEKMEDLTKGLQEKVLEKDKRLESVEGDYRNLVENALDIIYSVNRDDNFITINKAIEDILGYTKRELLGKSFLEIVHEDDKGKVNQAYLDALKGKRKLIRFCFKALTKKGEVKYLELSSHRSFNKRGELKKVEGVIRDVTAANLLEENLKFSENKYRVLIENAQDIIYTVDRAGTVTSINKVVEKNTGISPNDIINRNFTKFIHPEDVEKVVQSFEDIVSKKKRGTSGMQFRVINKKGEIILLELNSLGIYDKDGNFVMIEGILRDITKESKLKRELLRANDRFKSLFDSISESVYIADMEGKLLLVNNMMSKLFGCNERAEMIGRMASDFYLNPGDRGILMAKIQEKGFVKDFVAHLKRKDNTTFYAKIDTGIITNESGEAIGIQGVLKDVTRVINLEKEVERLKELERQRQQCRRLNNCKFENDPLKKLNDVELSD